MIWAQFVKSVAKVGITALVLNALSTSGSAQDMYRGKFSLPVETHWETATLPAGDYTFAVVSESDQYRLYIRGQRTKFIVPSITAENATPRRAQLNLVDIAGVFTVQIFDAPELGLTFTYWTPRQKRTASKEARQRAVPQAASATQSSENRTSTAVYAAGR